MTKIEITMRAVFWLDLTREDLEPLFILAEHHYDGYCRATVARGGFLYSWRNMISAGLPDNVPERPKCQAAWRELDTLLKICEMSRLAVSARLINQQQGEWVNNFCATLMHAMSESARAVAAVPVVEVTEADRKSQAAWALHPGRA